MADLTFFVDIEDSSGNKLGSGPLTSVSVWEYTSRLDQAGSFRFTMAASDPQRSIVQKKRIARAYALLPNGAWTEVGAGVIDSIVTTPQADGTTLMEVSGLDLTRELSYRTVKRLALESGGGPITQSAALALIDDYAPSGWTFTPDPSAPTTVYGRFNGESVLAALVFLAQKTQSHFYRGNGRTIIFGSSFTASGVRAIQAGPGDLAAETCAIVDLQQTIDTHDLITRIYPRGSGNGYLQLDLRATNRTAPAGYTLNTSENYIENNTATAAYGLIEGYADFREIGPLSNTAADVRAAANVLFDSALEELRRRSTELETAYYTLSLAGCSQLLRPLQTIRVDYFDYEAGLDIATDLNILETTWRVDAAGVQTTGLVVSSSDRWPQSDTAALRDSLIQGRIYQAHPQLSANEYVASYTKHLDDTQTAAFRFRFSDAVTQLQQVLFEFQLLPFESTVRAVGGATSGSGAIPTTGPSTNSTGTIGNNETGPATGGTGGPSTNESGGPSNNSSGGPSINATTGPANNTTGGPSTNESGGPSVNFSGPPSFNFSGGPNTNTTSGPSINSTGNPVGGDIESGGRHRHQITVNAVDPGPQSYPVYIDLSSTPHTFRAGSGMGQVGFVYTSFFGDHTHDISNHTHSLSNHTHDLQQHNHGLSNHTHSLNNHTHSLNNHTHSLNNHTHSLNGHTHSLNNHTHSLNNHTHTLNNHTHDLSESITAIYGLFREQLANTYVTADLEYRVNAGAWTSLDTALFLGDGWSQIDITSAVLDSTTLRPALASNTIEVRRKSTAPAGKTVTIDAQIAVRTVIQAIAITS